MDRFTELSDNLSSQPISYDCLQVWGNYFLVRVTQLCCVRELTYDVSWLSWLIIVMYRDYRGYRDVSWLSWCITIGWIRSRYWKPLAEVFSIVIGYRDIVIIVIVWYYRDFAIIMIIVITVIIVIADGWLGCLVSAREPSIVPARGTSVLYEVKTHSLVPFTHKASNYKATLWSGSQCA